MTRPGGTLGDVPKGVLGLPGVPRGAGTGGGGAGGGGRSAADRGPDRVMEMEGGNRFLLARRKAHRKDLLKEALNVGIGTVLVGLLSGALLHGLGVGLDATVLVALGAAAAGGWTLGREVLADLVENERAVKRGGWPR